MLSDEAREIDEAKLAASGTEAFLSMAYISLGSNTLWTVALVTNSTTRRTYRDDMLLFISPRRGQTPRQTGQLGTPTAPSLPADVHVLELFWMSTAAPPP